MQIFLGELLESNLGRLGPAEARHCVKVLRHQVGDLIHVVDGQGRMYQAKIIHTDKEEVRWIVEKLTDGWGEKSPLIRLAISPLRLKDRFEWAMEKAVELGVNEIFPIQCHRTDIHRSKFKSSRIETILLTALKQSKRSRLPVLHQTQSFSDFVSREYSGPAWLASCEADTLIQDYQEEIKKADTVSLLIGPEGDFTEEEVLEALHAGYRTISLGQNRLRSETAAIYGLSAFKVICGY